MVTKQQVEMLLLGFWTLVFVLSVGGIAGYLTANSAKHWWKERKRLIKTPAF